jgi:hypothetical protein
MTVAIWVKRARITKSPAGDLIADMREDKDLPDVFANIGAMRAYLRAHNACSEALAAVPIVWRRYKHWQDRHPFY